jgi:hypothetical protein
MTMDHDSDNAVLAEGFDDPTIVRALIELSKTNELANRRPHPNLARTRQRTSMGC